SRVVRQGELLALSLRDPPVRVQHGDRAPRERRTPRVLPIRAGPVGFCGRWACTTREGDVNAPLEGLRVIDVGTRIGAPFCAGLLGEWGADVIKVEDPPRAGNPGGDFMRTIGPFEDGYSLFWAVEGRGRRSVTCDLRQPLGQDLFRALAKTADVVVENFRPGTMA